MTERGKREKPPKRRQSVTYKFRLGGMGIHLTISTYEDGRVCEIFTEMGITGSTFQAVFHAWSISMSKALQYGVPLRELVDSYVSVGIPVQPRGELLCNELPSLHGREFQSPWSAITHILIEVTTPEGKLRP